VETSKRTDLSRTSRAVRGNKTSAGAARCRRKFLRFFPGRFRDETYLDWERGYKWTAHEQWSATLDRAIYRSLLRNDEFNEIATRAVRIESRTNLLFSFEKMALRDAVKSREGAHAFATGLYDFLYSAGNMTRKYNSRPSWETYANFLEFADVVKRDLRDLRPRDMIDIQSFMWVQGSEEYEE